MLCSIELLYYRTSVPSNERLAREADVSAKVAARKRAITGRTAPGQTLRARTTVPRQADRMAPRQVPRQVPRVAPGGAASASEQTRARIRRAAGAGNSSHLRLVTLHGRLVDPGFLPVEPVWVAGRIVRNEGAPQPGRRAAAGRRDAAAARRAGAQAGNGAARGTGVRLTRRGRLVITAALIMLIAVASMVASMVAASSA